MKEAPLFPAVAVQPLTHAITIRHQLINSLKDFVNDCPIASPSPPHKCVVCRETLLLFIFVIWSSSEGEQGPVYQADLLMLRHASSVLQNSRGTPQCVWRVWGDGKRDTSLMTAVLGAMNHFFLKTCPLVLHLPNATKSTRDQKS